MNLVLKKVVRVTLLAVFAISICAIAYLLFLAFGPPEWVARDSLQFAEQVAELVVKDGKCEGSLKSGDTEIQSYFDELLALGWNPEDIDRMGVTLITVGRGKLVLIAPFGFDEKFYLDVCNNCWQIADERLTSLPRCRVVPE